MAVTLAGAAALLLIEGWRAHLRYASGSGLEPLGPGRYLYVLGALLLAATIFAVPAHRRGDGTGGAIAAPVVWTVAMLIGFVALLPVVGFALAMAAFLALLFLVVSRFRPAASLAGAAAIAAALHLLFAEWLAVPLPALGRFGL